MKSKQMLYEMKPCDNDDWIEVSETIFLNRLLESFYPITPILQFSKSQYNSAVPYPPQIF
jgi:hypothetical protein